MGIAEWTQEMRLECGAIDALFNQEQEIVGVAGASSDYGLFLLDRTACRQGVQLRLSDQNIPQFDGSQLRRRFTTGQEVALTVSYWQMDGSNVRRPSCEDFLVAQDDFLMRRLRYLVFATNDETHPDYTTPARFFYEALGDPTGGRHLQEVRLSAAPQLSIDERGLTRVAFSFVSPFPYFISNEEYDETSFPVSVVNEGTAPYYPVWIVDGPTDGFVLEETQSGKQIVYDANLPGAQSIGASDYVEINTFKGTAFLNGDEDDLLAGIDPDATDFWPLMVGTNEVDVDGYGTGSAPTATLLWHHAWW